VRIGWTALVCLGLTSFARGQDEWPQFRGPGGQGHADAADLPLTWSETENVVWKTAIPGVGWSSPVIGGSRIWMTSALDEGRSLRAVCVKRESGEILHDVEVFEVAQPPALHATNSHASPTPVLENGRVYVHFGTNGTACLDAESGSVLWRNTELALDHEVGPGSSPVLWGDLLLLNCDGIDFRFVAALDKRTGELAWKIDRSNVIEKEGTFRKAFSTPLVIDAPSGLQAVSPGAEQVSAYDPATGSELWYVRYEGFSNVPRPVFGDGLVFVCTGFFPSHLLAIRPEGSGDITESGVVWRCTTQVPTQPSLLLVDGLLYMFADTGAATCLAAATGEEMWSERLSGHYSASPVYAAGRIYIGNEEGEMTVLAVGDEPEVLAVNVLDGAFRASPAVAGRELYLRTDTHLYRIEEK